MDQFYYSDMSLPPVFLPLTSTKPPALAPTSPNTTLDDDRYALFLKHTPTTAFLVGVKTTKIFCRTDCPARRARRANVKFFESVAAARGEGFRSCKRCKPESLEMVSRTVGLGEKAAKGKVTGVDGEGGEQSARLRAARKAQRVIIEKEGRVPWREVSKEVGLSPRYLFEAFKGVVGCTPGVWAERVKKGEIEGFGLAEEGGEGGVKTPETRDEQAPMDLGWNDWMSSQEMRDCLDEFGTPGLESACSAPSMGTPFSDAMLSGQALHTGDFDQWLLSPDMTGAWESLHPQINPQQHYAPGGFDLSDPVS